MKLNIKKLQEGGGMPFVVYQPTNYGSPQQDTQQAPTPKKEDSSNQPELLSKEIINELIKKGLPNEVNKFLNDLSSLQNSSITPNLDRNSIYSLASKANQIIHNSNLMDGALKQAYENDGLEELAVTNTGQIYVQDKNGTIGKVSMGEYNKKKDKYLALTVNDLSKARMYNSSLSFDQDIIPTIQNSLGIDKISDYMINIISKFGSESTTKEGYIDKQQLSQAIQQSGGKKPTESEVNGIQELYNMYNSMGKEGIYKVINEKSSERNHLSNALEYLWTMLPNNARNVLKARYIVDGNESANPLNVIKNALILHTSETNKQNLDYVTTMNTENKTGSNKDKQYNQGLIEKLINADLNVTNISLHSSDNSDYGLSLKGSTMSALPTQNNKFVGAAPLGLALQNSIWGTIDKDKMYFGNKKINTADLNNILYDGDQVANVMVPVNNDGSPNYSLLKNFQKAQEYLNNHKISDPNQKNKILEQFGLPMIKYDASGTLSQISKQYVKPFILIHGTASGAIDAANDNPMPHTLSGTIAKNQESYMDSIYKKHKMEYSKDGFLGMGKSFVQAPILIALSNSATDDAATMAGHGSLIKQNTLQEDIMRNNIKTLPTSSSLLFN